MPLRRGEWRQTSKWNHGSFGVEWRVTSTPLDNANNNNSNKTVDYNHNDDIMNGKAIKRRKKMFVWLFSWRLNIAAALNFDFNCFCYIFLYTLLTMLLLSNGQRYLEKTHLCTYIHMYVLILVLDAYICAYTYDCKV